MLRSKSNLLIRSILLALCLLAPAASNAFATCVSPSSALVSQWLGDLDGTDTTQRNPAFPISTTIGAGLVGDAFVLNGTSSYVLVMPNANLTPGFGSFTVEAWVQTSSGTGVQYILARKLGIGGTLGESEEPAYSLRLNAGIPELFVRNNGGGGDPAAFYGKLLSGSTTIADGAWHHLAGMRDVAAGVLRLYVDGNLVGSQPLNAGASGSITGTNLSLPLVIGARVEPSGSSARVDRPPPPRGDGGVDGVGQPIGPANFLQGAG